MLDDPPPKLRLHVRIVEVHDRERDPGIAAGVLRLQRLLAGTDHNAVAVASHPDRGVLGRAVRHQRCQMGEVRPVEEVLDLCGQGL